MLRSLYHARARVRARDSRRRPDRDRLRHDHRSIRRRRSRRDRHARRPGRHRVGDLRIARRVQLSPTSRTAPTRSPRRSRASPPARATCVVSGVERGGAGDQPGARQPQRHDRRQRVEVRHGAHRRPGDAQPRHQRNAREHAGAELRRPAARAARRERDPAVGARRQRHQPPGHVDAHQLAARPARRPLDLPRLLRPRALGLPAGEHVRHPADRGDPRAGVGGVGRQRAHRRRQRDHQDAAAGAGHDWSRSPAASSIATPARASAKASASCSAPTPPWRRRRTRSGRTACRPAISTPIRCRGRPARFR